jgi:hypothetical protein
LNIPVLELLDSELPAIAGPAVRNPDLIEVLMSLADAAPSSADNRHHRHADTLLVPGGRWKR